ncbi:MAG TPA: ABC transporter substrate-binding protein, partial [Pararhizobium sp.]|nr:ABC transporter substrate-binding protein [Pararhizobium sp.]
MAAAVISLFGEPAHGADGPARVVSIGGAVTEIVYALGEEDRLVGVDSTSTYPPAATHLPNIGYMRQLSAEGVLSLRPDLILMEEGAGPPAAVSVIDAAGIPVTHVPTGYDAAAIGRKIRTVADALGKSRKGEALA